MRRGLSRALAWSCAAQTDSWQFLLCSHAGVIAALPSGFLLVCAPSFSAALLPVSGSGDCHASSCAALRLVLPMLVLHGIRRVVILIALCATNHCAGRRTLSSAREAVSIRA